MNENRIVILDRGIKEMAGPQGLCCWGALMWFNK
jgi:hypothetical protein